MQIGGLYVCPNTPVVTPPKIVEENSRQEQNIVNPTGKVGGTASKPDDCKYEGAYMQIGGLYVCPNDRKVVVDTETPVKKDKGEICSEGGNGVCNSGDCRFISDTQSDNRNWYCMPETTNEDRVWASSPWNLNPITGPIAMAYQSLTGINALLYPSNQLPKGSWCYGDDNTCGSGYCADNWGIVPDTCEDNPFSQLNSSSTEDEDVASTDKEVINPTGKVGGTASKPDDCKYEGAYMQIGGLYVCPNN
jgi:hypothetical protein